MARRCRIEHDEIIVSDPILHDIGDALQQGSFMHPRRIARQCHMFVNFSVLGNRHQLMQSLADLLDVGFNRLIRVQLDSFQPRRDTDRAGPDWTGKQVPKIMRRVS